MVMTYFHNSIPPMNSTLHLVYLTITRPQPCTLSDSAPQSNPASLSDSPPPSPDPPPPLKHAAMDEETTDEDISPPGMGTFLLHYFSDLAMWFTDLENYFCQLVIGHAKGNYFLIIKN